MKAVNWKNYAVLGGAALVATALFLGAPKDANALDFSQEITVSADTGFDLDEKVSINLESKVTRNISDSGTVFELTPSINENVGGYTVGLGPTFEWTYDSQFNRTNDTVNGSVWLEKGFGSPVNAGVKLTFGDSYFASELYATYDAKVFIPVKAETSIAYEDAQDNKMYIIKVGGKPDISWAPMMGLKYAGSMSDSAVDDSLALYAKWAF